MLVHENNGQIQLFSLVELNNVQAPRPRRGQGIRRRQPPAQSRRQLLLQRQAEIDLQQRVLEQQRIRRQAQAQRRRQLLLQRQAEIDLQQRVLEHQRIQRQERAHRRQQQRDLLVHPSNDAQQPRPQQQLQLQLPIKNPKVLLKRLSSADLILINKQLRK